MTDKQFDNLYPVVTYDDWIVSEDGNGKYYVKDMDEDFISEVELVYKEPSNDIENIIDFGGNYDGETDDFQWFVSFKIKN